METQQPYHGLLGLDRLPAIVKILNWLVAFILVAPVALTVSSQPLGYFGDDSIWAYPALFSPLFLAVAWLRLTGVRWRYALPLLVIFPAVALGLWFAFFQVIQFLTGK